MQDKDKVKPLNKVFEKWETIKLVLFLHGNSGF